MIPKELQIKELHKPNGSLISLIRYWEQMDYVEKHNPNIKHIYKKNTGTKII